jgi:hypothetical protein
VQLPTRLLAQYCAKSSDLLRTIHNPYYRPPQTFRPLRSPRVRQRYQPTRLIIRPLPSWHNASIPPIPHPSRVTGPQLHSTLLLAPLPTPYLDSYRLELILGPIIHHRKYLDPQLLIPSALPTSPLAPGAFDLHSQHAYRKNGIRQRRAGLL